MQLVLGILVNTWELSIQFVTPSSNTNLGMHKEHPWMLVFWFRDEKCGFFLDWIDSNFDLSKKNITKVI